VGTDFKLSLPINYCQFGKHPTFWRLVLCPSTEYISIKFTNVVYNDEINLVQKIITFMRRMDELREKQGCNLTDKII
jgi:hypothetical protein